MIKVILIDDEPLAQSIVEEYLNQHADFEIVATCNNGYEGLKAIQNLQPDLIFLDIQMPKITGFEMLELVETLPAVIFTTAFDEFAMKAFEANAIDYLLKPFSKERFDKAIQKFLLTYHSSKEQNQKHTADFVAQNSISGENQHRIVVKNGADIRIIPIQEVHHIDAYDDYVKIYTGEKYFLKKKTMAYYEQSLDPQLFVRVHRSHIIALSQLTKIEPLEKDSHVALLKSGKRIPLSKSGFARLKEVLGV